MQLAVFDKRHHLRMRHCCGLEHSFIIRQQSLAAASIADQQFAVD